jgi:hypothetical protein
MGIYRQPNDWQCGPFALKHALFTLGAFAHEDELAAIAGSSPAVGTDEVGLGRAASAYRTELRVVRRRTAPAARRVLVRWLRRGLPVLLCVDQWDHWVTAVGYDEKEVVLLDSRPSSPTVLTIEPWTSLRERMVYRQRRMGGIWTRLLYDLQPIIPLRRPPFRFHLTPDRARSLLGKRAWLQDRWDEYARRLLPLASAPIVGRTVSLERFLEAHRFRIVRALHDRYPASQPGAASARVSAAAFVAGMYGMRTRRDASVEEQTHRLADAVYELSATYGPIPATGVPANRA